MGVGREYFVFFEEELFGLAGESKIFTEAPLIVGLKGSGYGLVGHSVNSREAAEKNYMWLME